MNRILAIDDNPDNLVTVTAMLKLFIRDCCMITATSGKSGIELAVSEQPDTILLDIHMPGMDSFEVCRHLKSSGATAHIPIIMLTAPRTDSKSQVRALELGADAFLTKPIDESELVAQVKAMLRIKRAEDKLRNETERLEELVIQRVNDLSIANEQLILEMAERERAQAELEMKSNAIENSLNGFNIFNNEGLLIYANKAYVTMWGYDNARDILDTSFIDHCLDPNIPDTIIHSLQKNQECEIEFTARRKDGSTFEVLMYARLSHDGENQELYTATSIDITDQKTAQKTKKELEAQLIQAQKMEAVGALAGGIAHDFNNILFPILGYAELLKQDTGNEGPINDSVTEILNAARRAQSLVKQILTFSRQMDQEIRTIKVQPILKEVISLSKAIIPTTITIREDIDKSCLPIIADPTQIHQMTMNLITNAYHAMQETGGTLLIQLKQVTLSRSIFRNRQVAAGDYLCLSIQDTGSGIKKNIINNIFDPYFTTKGIDKGTGLGLSVVHGIVKNAHGEIFVDSVPDQGTTFEIYLPVIHERRQEPRNVSPALPRGVERVLLVDDEPNVTKVISRMLERLGYTVTIKNSPLEAFELLLSEPDQFDIMISDMTMPGMTGEQLSRKVLAVYPDFPIIMCTGYSEGINEGATSRMGIKALLMKPVVLSELAQTMRKSLGAADK